MPISPNQGSTSGGTTVTITGVNLAGATSVNFGSNSAIILSNTPTSVTVTSPAGTGVVNVAVTTNGGTSNFLAFYYISPPIVVSLAPYYGPVSGGNTVTISGYNLATATSVTFGSNAATPTVTNDGTLSVVAPAAEGVGSVNIIVTTSGGVSAAQNYVYVDSPTITTISPTSGSVNGGSSVTITGTNLLTTSAVSFGGVSASFGVINNTTISVITPANTAGAVDVVVTTSGGSATAAEGFTYISGPGI
jgi:hypothetical protein